MVVVLFELQALPGQNQTYVDLVNKLTPMLKPMEGFISVECFQSTLNPEKVMSVTTWRDEEAVVQWRNVEAHLSAQRAGRDKIFKDYRVRVTQVLTLENFQALRNGLDTQDSVRRRFGPPALLERVASFDGPIWTYRILDNGEPRQAHVHIDPAGVVRRVMFTDERLRDLDPPH